MRRNGLLAAAVLMLFGLGACASDITKFSPRKTTIEPGTYVVAFSINTLFQGGTVPRKGEPRFSIDQLNVAGGKPIQMFGAEAGIGLALIEVPTASLQFEALGLVELVHELAQFGIVQRTVVGGVIVGEQEMQQEGLEPRAPARAGPRHRPAIG